MRHILCDFSLATPFMLIYALGSKKQVLIEDPEQPINSARMKAYQRFDLHIQRRWFSKKLNLLTYLEIDNVFNTKNVWLYNHNEDGTISTIYQFGLMIVGGVMVEF